MLPRDPAPASRCRHPGAACARRGLRLPAVEVFLPFPLAGPRIRPTRGIREPSPASEEKEASTSYSAMGSRRM